MPTVAGALAPHLLAGVRGARSVPLHPEVALAVLRILLVPGISRATAGGLAPVLRQCSTQRPADPVETQRLTSDALRQVLSRTGRNPLRVQHRGAEVEQGAQDDLVDLAHPLVPIATAGIGGELEPAHLILDQFLQGVVARQRQRVAGGLHVDLVAVNIQNLKDRRDAQRGCLGIVGQQGAAGDFPQGL